MFSAPAPARHRLHRTRRPSSAVLPLWRQRSGTNRPVRGPLRGRSPRTETPVASLPPPCLPLPVLSADLPRPRRLGTAGRAHRPARPLAHLLQPGPLRHLLGQDPRPAPRLLRTDHQPTRVARSPPLGWSTLRPGGGRTPGTAPSIPRGPRGRDRLADQRPARLGLVLPRPAAGPVPHRPPPQSRGPHPGPGRIVRRDVGQRFLRGLQRVGLRQATVL